MYLSVGGGNQSVVAALTDEEAEPVYGIHRCRWRGGAGMSVPLATSSIMLVRRYMVPAHADEWEKHQGGTIHVLYIRSGRYIITYLTW